MCRIWPVLIPYLSVTFRQAVPSQCAPGELLPALPRAPAGEQATATAKEKNEMGEEKKMS